MAGTSDITQVRPSYICQSVTSSGVGESRLSALECIEVSSVAEGVIAEIAPTLDVYRWDPSSLAAPGASVVIPLGQSLGTPGRWLLVSSTTPASAYYQFIEGVPLASTLIPSSGATVAALQQNTLTFKNGDIVTVGPSPTGYTQLTLHNQQVWFTDILGNTVAENRRARIRFVASDETPGFPVSVADEPATDSTVVTLYSSLAASAPLAAVLVEGNTSSGTNLVMDAASHLQLTAASEMDVQMGCTINLNTVATLYPDTNKGVFSSRDNGFGDSGSHVSVIINPLVNSGGDVEVVGGENISGILGADILVQGAQPSVGGGLTLTAGEGSDTVPGGSVSIVLPSAPVAAPKGPGDFSVSMGDSADNAAVHGSIQMEAASNVAGATQKGAKLILAPGVPSGIYLSGGGGYLYAGDGAGTGRGGGIGLFAGASAAHTAASLAIVGSSTARAGYTVITEPLVLLPVASDPAIEALYGAGQLYTKTSGGQDQLFWETQTGVVHQITPAAVPTWAAVLASGNTSGATNVVMNSASHLQLTASAVLDVATGSAINLTTVAQIAPGTNQGVFSATSNVSGDGGGSVYVKKDPAAGVGGNVQLTGGSNTSSIAGADILVQGAQVAAGGGLTFTAGTGSNTVPGGSVSIVLPSAPVSPKGSGNFSISMGDSADNAAVHGSIQMEAASNVAGATQKGAKLILAPGVPSGVYLSGGGGYLYAGDGAGTGRGGGIGLFAGASAAHTAASLAIVGSSTTRAGYTVLTEPLVLLPVAADPAIEALYGAGQLYTKTSGGQDQLFWETQTGVVHQITPVTVPTWAAVLASGNTSGATNVVMNSASHLQLTASAVLDVATGSAINLTTVAQIAPGTNQGVFSATSNVSGDGGGSVYVKKNVTAGYGGDVQITGGSNTSSIAGADITVQGAQDTASGGGLTFTTGRGSATVRGGSVTFDVSSASVGSPKGSGNFRVILGSSADATASYGYISLAAGANTSSGVQEGASLSLNSGSPAGATLAGGAALLGAGAGTVLGGQLTLSGGSSAAKSAASLYLMGATATREGYTKVYEPIAPVARASDPASLTTVGQLYAKTVSGDDQLFWETAAGTVYQITPPGASAIPWISMPDCNTVNSINGFINRTSSTLTATAGTRTFQIAAAPSYQIYSYTYPYTKSGTETSIWDDIEGAWWFYYDSSGVLQKTNSSAAVSAALSGGSAIVAQIYWDATNKVVVHNADERHGFMDTPTHAWAHETIGALWVSGGAPTGFTIGNGGVNTHAQFAIQDVIIRDEDIRMVIADDTPQNLSPILYAPVYYLSGAGVWRKKTADTYPFIQSGALGMSAGVPVVIYTGAGGRVAYNRLNAGVWSLSEVQNNNYVLVHIYATTSWTEPVIAIAGQAEYASIANAQAGASTELLALANLTTIFGPEAVPIASVIIQTANTYGNTPKARVVQNTGSTNYYDWRGNKYKGGAGTNTQPLPVGVSGDILQNTSGVWNAQAYIDTVSGVGLAHTAGFIRGGPVDTIISAKLAAASSISLLSTYDGGGFTGMQIGASTANGVTQIYYDVAASGNQHLRVNGVSVLAINGTGVYAYQPLDMSSQKITSLGSPSAATDAPQFQNLYKQPAANIALGSGVTINDWAPTDLATLTHLMCSSGPSDVDITGISSTGLVTKQKYFIQTSSANVNFHNENAGSAAANRIITYTGATVVASFGHMTILVYDSIVSRWRLFCVWH